MFATRIIPCLLLRNGGLYKTEKFSKPKYVGDPINAIRIFNEKEVDELLVLDITASREGKEPNYDLIEEFASECFMPLAYGGGITKMEQARRLFASGVEKICIQSSALDNPSLVTQLASQFGSQSVMVSVDVKKNWVGQYKLYSSKDQGTVSIDWLEFIKKMIEAGAGEILLNAVDRDGTMAGMDLTMIEKANAVTTVPMIATGGVGSLKDIQEGIAHGADAISAGAFFVFQGPHKAVLISYPKYSELEKTLKRK